MVASVVVGADVVVVSSVVVTASVVQGGFLKMIGLGSRNAKFRVKKSFRIVLGSIWIVLGHFRPFQGHKRSFLLFSYDITYFLDPFCSWSFSGRWSFGSRRSFGSCHGLSGRNFILASRKR